MHADARTEQCRARGDPEGRSHGILDERLAIVAAVKLLEGKTALVTGVANRWSIATGIARAFHEHGARLSFIYQGERVEDEVRKLAAELGGGPCWPCDVTSDDDLRRLADDVRVSLVGSTRSSIRSRSSTKKIWPEKSTTRRARVSRWRSTSRRISLIALVGALRRHCNDNASVMALTYSARRQSSRTTTSPGSRKPRSSRSSDILPTISGDRGIRVNAISAGPIKTASSRQVEGFSTMLESVGAARRCIATSPPKTSAIPPSISRSRSFEGRNRRRSLRRRRLPRDGHVSSDRSMMLRRTCSGRRSITPTPQQRRSRGEPIALRELEEPRRNARRPIAMENDAAVNTMNDLRLLVANRGEIAIRVMRTR